MSITFKSIKIGAIKSIINLFNTIGMKKNNYHVKPKNILMISTTGIGDTLWGTPAIRALKEAYPECYAGVLTNSAGAALLKENPNIDELFVFKRGLSGIFSLPGLLKNLRKKKFEIVFIFHASDRIIWPIAFFTGAETIIGINGDSKGLDFILTNPVDRPGKSHGIENRLALIQQIGISAKQKQIEIFLTNDEKEWADRFLEEQGVAKDSIIIGLHPGAQKPYKCWPEDNFISLGSKLTNRFKCTFLITGDKEEANLSDMVSSKLDNAISIAGKLTLRESAAIIGKMRLFITNDTGPMHIAFALKTPTIAIFSPTNPELCGPYNAQGKFKVITKPMTCDPCTGKRCEHPECLQQITADEVLAEAESILKN